jgi:Homeodomain-like domain
MSQNENTPIAPRGTSNEHVEPPDEVGEYVTETVVDEPKPGAKMGRPSIPFLPEYADVAGQMSDDGASCPEIAAALGISLKTLERWRGAYPDLRRAIKVGKGPADERVKRSLYERATGYSYAAVKVFHYQGRIIKARVVEHVPPDTLACIFWLKNRDPEAWRDVQRIEHDVTKLTEAVKERLANGRKRLSLAA